MVATRSAQAVQSFIQSSGKFIDLYQMSLHPVTLAIRGFFPELLVPLAKGLETSQKALHQLSPAQQEFEIAYLLVSKTKPATEAESLSQSPATSVLPIPPEQILIQSIPEKIKIQKNELYEWAKNTFKQKMLGVSDCFTKDFLISMLKICPQGTELSVHMRRQIREVKGLPDYLGTMIVSAWSEAETQVTQWHLPGAHVDSINLCKEYFAMTRIEELLFNRIEANKTANKAPSYRTEFSHRIATQRTSPMNQFAENPVVFLNSLEKSLGQPVADDSQLANTFCLATGLTPTQSQKIVELWKEANHAAAHAFLANDVEKRHQFACRIMADSLKTLLPAQHRTSEGTPYPMSLRWQVQLQHWCDSVLAQETRVATNDGNNDDTEESRPFKRARYEYQ
jgi:hypothetical protein